MSKPELLMIDFMLKKDPELIQTSIDLVKERYPGIPINQQDYSCRVWRNPQSVAVDFTRIIRYVPIERKETELEYDIIVNLTANVILPFEKTLLGGQFYIPSASDMEAIAFVKQHFGAFSANFKNTIIEETEEYKISCTNEASFGYYSIDKITGAEGPSRQGSYLVVPKPDLEGNDHLFGN